MSRVMKSQVAHMVSQSSIVGTPNGDEAYAGLDTLCASIGPAGDDNNGKLNGGRSNNQREYWEALSIHWRIGRKFPAANSL